MPKVVGVVFYESPGMIDFHMTDDQRELFRQADRMAQESKSERLAWLLQLRQQLKDHPNIDSIICSLSEYMDAHKNACIAKVRQASLSERLEADAFTRLERLLELTPEEYGSQLSVEGIAQIALLSILLSPLRERALAEDAQEKLWNLFNWLLKHPTIP
ncbi:MAG: hypothetical protein SH850_27730 [Planctomycetaceae bacterium]|nr:hypothetical protein [Planctomycetaceae bacterium]